MSTLVASVFKEIITATTCARNCWIYNIYVLRDRGAATVCRPVVWKNFMFYSKLYYQTTSDVSSKN